MKRLVVIVLAAAALALAQQEDFEYRVHRVKVTRDEPGQLRITKDGVDYRADKAKTSFRIPLKDIHEIEATPPKRIRVETYDRLARELGGRREYTFRLRDGAVSERLVQFLAAHVNRPVIGDYGSASEALFRIAAYHRHRFGGAAGDIELDQQAVRFTSEKPGESRTWPYRDIETVGAMNAFHFRVSTLAETYNFDLKERLPDAAYDFVVRQIHGLR